MIALLTGVLCERTEDHAIIDVHGVGYSVAVSAHTHATLPAVGQPVTIHIHTHVREDQITLFGFAQPIERSLFLRLVSVNGVGPRLALTILSGLSAQDFIAVLSLEDTKRLTAVPGIGKKTAERIILDLRDRVLKDHAEYLQLPEHGVAMPQLNHEAVSALLNLGYAQAQAEQAVKHVQGRDPELPLGAIIKDALREMAKR